MTQRPTFRAAAVWFFALVLISAPAPGEPLPWDQEAATQLALEITVELRELLVAAAAAPSQPSVMQQRKRDAAAFQVRHALMAAEELLSKLREGWDRDATEAYFQILRIEGEQVLETYGDAQRMKAPTAHWNAATAAARKLAGYYHD
jgi:hypothetical protein